MTAAIPLAIWTLLLGVVWVKLSRRMAELRKREKRVESAIAGYYWEASRRQMYAAPRVMHQSPVGYRGAYSHAVEGQATYSTFEDLLK